MYKITVSGRVPYYTEVQTELAARLLALSWEGIEGTRRITIYHKGQFIFDWRKEGVTV